MLKKVGFVLVLLMAILQGFYGLFAYIDPVSFSEIRGTKLFSSSDIDWVLIYASRTLFISILIGYLLYLKQFKVLIIAAMAGTIMPVTDAWLAYVADAPANVVVKHLVTVVYLLCTATVLTAVDKARLSDVE